MREATTSSASSESTRRASSVSRSSDYDPESDPPSTPPEQADDPTIVSESPAHQRDLHQKKRRRSSAIPPMNFNDPDQDYSSSPVSGSSPMTGSEDAEEESEDDMDDDDEGTAMSLVSAENTADITARSYASNSTSDSSARLDAALKQAANQAGTRGIAYDEHGDMSMEMATEEVTNAFQPWAQKNMGLTPMAKNLIAIQDQENINPFSPAFRAHVVPGRPSTITEEDDDDSSMDMTRAMGGIVGFQQPAQDEQSIDDDSMDFTQVVGKIYQPVPIQPHQLKSALKRRLSTVTTDTGSPLNTGLSGPEKQDELRASKRRRSSGMASSLGEATMDFTTAVGNIQAREVEDETMDFTTAVGSIQNRTSPVKQNRRTSVRNRRRSSVQSVQSEQNDQTMDFTTAIGSIRPTETSQERQSVIHEDSDENEEVSMEFTGVLPSIAVEPAADEISRPMTPRNFSSPERSDQPTTPKDQGRFKEANDMSAKKLLTPIFENQIETSIAPLPLPMSQTPTSIQPARRSSTRLSKGPAKSPMKNPAQLPVEASPGDVVEAVLETTLSRSPRRQSASPPKVEYPTLPSPKAILTPKTSPSRPTTIPQQSPPQTPRTPLQDNASQSVQVSPLVEKQLRSSAEKAKSTPDKERFHEASRSLSDTIKLLSTPRKESGTSPLKRLKEMTPKTAPVRKMLTPRQLSTPKLKVPQTEVKAKNVDTASRQLNEEFVKSLQSNKPVEKVQLNEFLDLAGIKFMDLTTTKRRYTVAPTPTGNGELEDEDMAETGSHDVQLENAVVAGACTVPELDLYQHSCRELKRYISEGKSFLKTLETGVYKDSPPLIQAYVGAQPEHKAQLDAHLRDAKTLARLQSKELWYGWRSQLLEGLEDGLRAIQKDLESDEQTLTDKEALLEAVLPVALQLQDEMRQEVERLEESAAAISDEDKEELDLSRQRLIDANEAVRQRKRVVKNMQQELEEQDRLAEMYIDSRAEALAAIEEAERIKEASRGFSVEEVAELNGKSNAQE